MASCEAIYLSKEKKQAQSTKLFETLGKLAVNGRATDWCLTLVFLRHIKHHIE
jgi:hypothetical protein